MPFCGACASNGCRPVFKYKYTHINYIRKTIGSCNFLCDVLKRSFSPMDAYMSQQACVCSNASVVGVVVSSLALHRGDPGSIPGGSAYRQFGFMPKMDVHTCYNSQKVTAASV